MSPQEIRASASLASIFGLRMLGMFVILPVFAIYAEGLPGGDNLTLVGVAIGVYGLTQAILQIPFGWWSDRYGRKPVIFAGLAVFAIGSFVAALGIHIWVVILGRTLQGAGAISAAVMAMAADLTREQHRTKAMAIIGSTIGATFALSLVLAPWFNRMIGVPGIFVMTGVLVLIAIWVVYAVVPDAPEFPELHSSRGGMREFFSVLRDAQLARLNYGIFTLHAVLMALFIAVPLELRAAGLPVDHHWEVYLPVMVGSFVLMVPAVLRTTRPERLRRIFIGAVATLLASQVLLPWVSAGVWTIAAMLLVFFTAFNVLEAALPSLVTRTAPPGAKGVAIGVFTSLQFLGTFAGAAGGGYLYGRWGEMGIVVLDVLLLGLWLAIARGLQVPSVRSARVYALRPLDGAQADRLEAGLRALPGVHEARVESHERRAYLTVDSTGFDEENVVKLIAGAPTR
ncbi:MAG TPA: MFS transporter [Burkholderiales bacterium]|nr:MFS transporter [Burkholderiales bacterium]